MSYQLVNTSTHAVTASGSITCGSSATLHGVAAADYQLAITPYAAVSYGAYRLSVSAV
jgi:hypothetical protein